MRSKARAMLGGFFLALASHASADPDVQLPARKPGYWEIRIETQKDSPPMLTRLCIDAATDREANLAALSMTEGMCEKNVLKRDGDTFVMDSECAIGARKLVSRTVTSGDFQSAYEVKVTGTVENLPQTGGDKGPAATSLTQTAKWLAEKCPEGLKPGDLQMPDGSISNTKEIFGIAGAGQKKPK